MLALVRFYMPPWYATLHLESPNVSDDLFLKWSRMAAMMTSIPAIATMLERGTGAACRYNCWTERMDKMIVVPYSPEHRDDFIALNTAWISEMFTMEPEDERELANVDGYIAAGGQIFFALDDDGAVMACCLIGPREDGDWEIMKFAASDKYSGKGAGSACLEACIDYARERGIERIIIVTNSACEAAIHLYRKFGFEEMPVDKKKFPFERANVAFQMPLT